jgi:hypothetical protein
MKCQCGEKADVWIKVNEINVPKCAGCYLEISRGFVPPLDGGRNFTPRLGLTPRQAAKLGTTTT